MSAVLAATLMVTGCSSISPPDSGDSLRSDVKVDTPELRTQKATTKLADCVPGNGAPTGAGLPDLTLPCLGGGPSVNLSSLRGPMVINLWAAWCAPCRRELPIYQKFQERYGDQVAVLGIDFQDTQPGAALELAKETGVTYPQLADPNSDLSFAKPFGNITGLPGIVFIDKDGAVVDADGQLRILFREIKNLGELEALVDEYLGIKL